MVEIMLTDQLEKTWKEKAKVQLQYLSGRAAKNHKKIVITGVLSED